MQDEAMTEVRRIIELLTDERKRQRFTVEDFAGMAEISKNAMYRWINGTNIPSLYSVLLMCKALGFEMIVRKREEA